MQNFVGKIFVNWRSPVLWTIFKWQGETIHHTISFLKWQDCLLKLISDDLHMCTDQQPPFSARFTAPALINMEVYLSKIASGVWLSFPELFTETAFGHLFPGDSYDLLKNEAGSHISCCGNDILQPAVFLLGYFSILSYVKWWTKSHGTLRKTVVGKVVLISSKQKVQPKADFKEVPGKYNHRSRPLTRWLVLGDHTWLHRP